MLEADASVASAMLHEVVGVTSDLISQLPAFVEQVLLGFGYLGLLLLMVAENLFPPLPSELILPLAGFLVTLDRLQLVWVLLISTLGSVLGALLLYAAGKYLGDTALRRLLRRYGRYLGMSESAYDRASDIFRRNSAAVLFWGRFVPAVRSVVALPAGVTAVPLPTFLLWTTLGSFCWNAGLIGAGVLLGRNWTRVLAFMHSYERVIFLSIGALLVGALIYYGTRLWAQRRAGNQSR